MRRRIIAVVLLVVILFTAFASISYADTKKETGLYKVDGKWKYYENGKFTKATGLVMKPDKKTWHYVEDGVYKKVTGLVKCVQPGQSQNKWYYVEKGDQKKVTGLVKCVQPGSSKGKWYYVKSGKKKSYTGLVKCVQPGSSKGKLYYVKKGKKANTTGYVYIKNKDREYYVKKGKVDLEKDKGVQIPSGKMKNYKGKIELQASTLRNINGKPGPAYMQAKPDSSSKKVGEIPYGAKVKVLTVVESGYTSMVFVEYKNKRGWVNGVWFCPYGGDYNDFWDYY